MNDLLSLTILTALYTAGLLFCFTKWGWLSWYQVYRKRWMPEGDCYFCLSFWLSIPIFMANLPAIGEPWYELHLGPHLASATLSAFVCTVIIGTSEG